MSNNAEKHMILEWIENNRETIIADFKEFVRIPSLTGEEGACQEFMINQLQNMGIDPDVFEPDIVELFDKYPAIAQYPTHWKPELDLILRFDDICTYEQLQNSGYASKLNYNKRPNVVGTLKGQGGGKSLILNGHIDVVTVGDESKWKHKPFAAEQEGTKIYGRGSSDMKGGLWSCTKALESIIRCGVKLKGDVILQSVVNEEHSGNGSLYCVAKGYHADGAICAEPTSAKSYAMNTGGGVYWEIKTVGKEVHTGARWKDGNMNGVSAIEKMAPLLCAIREQERKLNENQILLSLGIGIINGGTYATATAAECVVSGVVYYSPELGTGEGGIQIVKDMFKEAISIAAAEDSWLAEHKPILSFLHYDDAYKYPSGSKFLDTLKQSINEVSGCEAQSKDFSACDARHLGNRGNTPTIVYGPGEIALAHSVDEYIDIEDMMQAIKIIATTIYDWCI